MRRFFLMLMAALWGTERLPQGKFRALALRALARHIGSLEHALRCLLLLMRVVPAPSAKLPEVLSRNAASPRRRRASPRFSLSLTRLAEGFAHRGLDVSALKLKHKANTARNAPPPRGPTACAPIADPSEILRARLDAICVVFADPHRHAAKLSALLRANGLALRALRNLKPDGALWILTKVRAPGHNPALPVSAPNTS